MTEWLVEEGIGEDRAILLDGGTIVAARVDWLEGLAAGQVEDAVLIHRATGSPRGTARFACGEEALADGLPRDAREGAPIRLAVTRAAMPEPGRVKLAQARPDAGPLRPRPSLAQGLRDEGFAVRSVAAFPPCDWEDLHDEATTGRRDFAGGVLHFTPTPAMTVVDIDGTLPRRELPMAAAGWLAETLARLDLAGNIAIDFPTLADKADRKAVDAALGRLLDHWPHERTAMNGFGLVQIVARLKRVSLLHRFQLDPAGAAARLLLRRAERVAGAGVLELSCHPAVRAAITPAWEAALARRTGRTIAWRIDPALALDAGFAQAVAP